MNGQTFGKQTKEFKAGKQVWRYYHKGVLTVGGVIDNAADFADQGFIPAGSICTYTRNTANGRTIHIVKAAELGGATPIDNVAGFLLYDCVFDNGVTPDNATGSVCYEGCLYVDRLQERPTDEQLKQLKAVLPLMQYEPEAEPETT